MVNSGSGKMIYPGMIDQGFTVILFKIGKNCLIRRRSLLFYQLTRRAMKPTVVINYYWGVSLLGTSYKVLSNSKIKSVYMDEIIGEHECGFHCKIDYGSDFVPFSGA
jgi:hypothetical protein